MKAKRHAKILELINSRPIDTQDELLGLLRESGFSVTQATVSRDIKELRLVKTLTPDGKYHYAAHADLPKSEMSNKFLLIFSESVKEIDSAGNMLVIKCFTGMANAVCAALDTLHWSGRGRDPCRGRHDLHGHAGRPQTLRELDAAAPQDDERRPVRGGAFSMPDNGERRCFHSST